tara:strand:+ start:206 stop:358 length:153 start_codon:yes stop_codon:yes gene_type:complete
MMVQNPNKQLSVETGRGKMVLKNKPNPLKRKASKYRANQSKPFPKFAQNA